MKMNPFISVIVVAYNAKKDIKDCLDSLLNQSYPRGNYEIIVVVDDEETHDVIKNYPIVEYHRKKKGNIPSARNDGISIAKGEIIAFTDSDCVVDVRWLENISKSFNIYTKISAVGGLIKPYETDPVSSSLAILNMVGYSSGNLSFERQFPTSNAAYKKESLDAIGGFDENALVGEDIDLYRRLKENNNSLLFNPNVIVYHKHRAKLLQVFLWCYNTKKKSLYAVKKYKLYKNAIRQFTPAFLSLLFVMVIPVLVIKNLILPAILFILFIVYLFTYSMYRGNKYLNLKTFIILPVVVLVISSGFLTGYLSGYINIFLNDRSIGLGGAN